MSTSGSTVLLQGYLDKKKRKAYQGFAKRYFVLSTSGILSYCRVQGEQIRDSVDIHRCSIGRSKKRRQIVIDSGKTVPWHCKALSDGEFERWTAAFQNFAHVSPHTALSHGHLSHSPIADGHAGDHLITAEVAEALVAVITNMTKSIAALERLALESTTSQSPSMQGGNIIGKAVNYATSTASSVAHTFVTFDDAASVNSERLVSAVNHLKEQHRSALHLLDQSHLASDDYALKKRMSISESIAASEYYDAEAGESYELDADLEDSSSYATSTSDSGSGHYQSDEETEAEDDSSSTASIKAGPSSKGAVAQVQRRRQLPHPIAGEEVSLFGLLKRNMGKDLSKISFPVTLNEPIDQLQAMAEPFEYSELLDTAAKQKDSVERLLYIATFVVASYAPSKYRSSRKPFNPLLGQTFELVRPEKNLKIVAEKVVHHPNWTACHAIGKAWDYTATASGAQKFWGRSYEILPEGMNEVRLKDHDEVYTWKRPPTYIKNIMSGEKYLEHVGQVEIRNEETGEHASISFKEGSSWGGASSRNRIEGKVYDAHDKVKIEFSGKWDESLARNKGGKNLETIWQINEFPDNAPKYYGFSTWTAQLNEITSDIKDSLPPTDTRLRPDQRALEVGDVNEAERGKQALEQKQRDRRKAWEQRPEDKKPPQFFKEGGEGVWHYTGDYWERRERKDWRKDVKIFEM